MEQTEKAIITIHDGYVAIKTAERGVVTTKYVSPDTFGKAMASGVNFDVGLLPKNCIAYKKTGFSHIFALVSPGSIRKVKYLLRGNNKTKLETFEIPFPNLLWIVHVNCVSNELGKVYVHAIKDPNVRMKTEIFYPPFSNIHSNGDICWGSYSRIDGTKYKSMLGLTVIPDTFFNLDFNTDLDCSLAQSFQKELTAFMTEGPRSYAFFSYLKTKEIKEFPYDVLATRKLTFKTLWGGETDDENDF